MSKKIQVATIILAGGQGTRLHPLTIHHSKPAISYGGRYRLIDIPISNSLHSDLRQIFVIAQYLSGELQHHIAQTYPLDRLSSGSIDVLTPQESSKGEKQWFLGTADAVRKNLPTLLKSSADYFLILAGDQLYNIDFQSMIAFAKEKQADLTIAALPVLEKEAKRMGLLKLDPTQRITDFFEKPTSKEQLKTFQLSPSFFEALQTKVPQEPTYLGSMGIYIFKRNVLVELLHMDQRADFGEHLIQSALTTFNTFGFTYLGYWEDIGTIASYYEANLMLTTERKGLDIYDEQHPIFSSPTYLPGPKITSTQINHSIVCEGSLIEAKEISHCVIGMRSYIKKGTVLKDTVMLGNYGLPSSFEPSLTHDFWIGENCVIEKAIIDEQVQIGDRVRLTNQQKLTDYTGEYLCVRDGIIIVPTGVKIPNDFEF